MEPRPEPDEVVVHVPGACRSCGGDLSSAPVVGEQVRQVFDLPPIELVVAEHRAQQRACGCGAVTTASFLTMDTWLSSLLNSAPKATVNSERSQAQVTAAKPAAVSAACNVGC